ncbi:MAG: hypothetical protein Ct9H300mP7_6880 [Verrucomicrobiota bacterium]|nr:MAG: hypothetical protein Ct9H300mP7_6880 [Verrucomicrobiota bacterium]
MPTEPVAVKWQVAEDEAMKRSLLQALKLQPHSWGTLSMLKSTN